VSLLNISYLYFLLAIVYESLIRLSDKCTFSTITSSGRLRSVWAKFHIALTPASTTTLAICLAASLGIVSATISISLFLVCLNNLILMMNIASRCKTLFYRLVAVGLGVTYGVQVFLTVGVTLPFVSYGGSSILSSLIMFALINGMYNMRQDEGDRKDGRKKKTIQTKKKTKRSE